MSRDLKDLIYEVEKKAQAFISAAKQAGIRVLVTDTRRTFQEQQDLYNQGRTKPGKIVTKAKPGDSWHNYGRAFDAVPLDKEGNPDYDAPRNTWVKLGKIAKSVGLEWGGDWSGFLDVCHFQDRSGMTLAEAKKKESPEEEQA